MSGRCLTRNQQFSSHIMAKTSYIQCNDKHIRFVHDQSAKLGLYSASSLKQQSDSRHVVLLIHTILVPKQQIFAITPYNCLLNGEAEHTIFTVLGLSPSVFELNTRG